MQLEILDGARLAAIGGAVNTVEETGFEFDRDEEKKEAEAEEDSDSETGDENVDVDNI